MNLITRRICPTCGCGHSTNNFARHVRTCKGKRKSADAPGICALCNKSFRADNFRRHRITCKGEKPKQTQCTTCGKSFRNDNLKRHRITCKGGGSHTKSAENIHRLVVSLENTKNENQVLQSRLLVLQRQLSKERDDKLARIDQLCKEKDDKIELRGQLCKEKDDKLYLRSQLSDSKEHMARRELEFAQKLSAMKVQLLNATAPRTTTINNTNYVLRMKPWCLDATSPEYEACLQADSDAIGVALGASLPADATSNDYFNLDAPTRGKYRRIFTKYILDSVLHGKHPRYVVPDLARLKGVYVMPNGEVKCDAGMALFMQHHFKMQMKSPVLRYDDYLWKKSSIVSLKRLYGSEGHSGANRVHLQSYAQLT